MFKPVIIRKPRNGLSEISSFLINLRHWDQEIQIPRQFLHQSQQSEKKIRK